jgi:hypothetical protein
MEESQIITDLKKEISKAVQQSKIVKPENITQVRIYPDRKGLPLPPNIMVFQKFILAAAAKLTPAALRVFNFFMGLSEYENFVGMDIKTIMEYLSIKSEKTVIEALNELTKYNVVIKVKNGRDRRRNDYYINPVAAWKGNSFSRNKHIQTLLKQHTENKDQLNMFSDNEPLQIESANDLK